MGSLSTAGDNGFKYVPSPTRCEMMPITSNTFRACRNEDRLTWNFSDISRSEGNRLPATSAPSEIRLLEVERRRPVTSSLEMSGSTTGNIQGSFINTACAMIAKSTLSQTVARRSS